MNPCWQTKPVAVEGQKFILHEVGDTDDGASRNGKVYAESGAIEIGDGDVNTKVDRIWPDISALAGEPEANDAVTMTFKLRQAPDAPMRTYGPVSLANPQGYSTVRFRARQVVIRIDQIKDRLWAVGKTRLRVKEAGKR
jgi:hypothetical protein